MIFTRTPLRISFAGGGSDLPAFTDGEHGEQGAVLSVSTNLSVYICVKRNLTNANKIRLAYTQTEEVDHVDELKHDLARACLRHAKIDTGVEITSIADVPAGTGLGSSAAFTVGLLNALYSFRGWSATPTELAYRACVIEIEQCGKPIGRQDQFAAAIGGLALYSFWHGSVAYEPVYVPVAKQTEMERNLLLLWTNKTRDAAGPLRQQAPLIERRDSRTRADIRAMANMAHALKNRLQDGDIHALGDIMNSAWALKKSLPGVADDQILHWCQLAANAARPGPFGIKLLGAGGGGCLLVYAEKERHPQIIESTGLIPIPFRFSRQGTTVVWKA